MPLNKDIQDGGTEADGVTRSEKYCSMCYVNGAFINPEMTLKEMEELVDKALKNEVKMWAPLRWLAVKNVKRLDRWKK